MATYATQAELEAYADIVFDVPADAEAVLERAERDVDAIVGPWLVESNGLKFGAPAAANEKGLEAWQVAALSRATCAQAQYRLAKGEPFFVEGQYESVRGPDFSVTGKLPYIGPKVWRELAGSQLFIAGEGYSVRTPSMLADDDCRGVLGNR